MRHKNIHPETIAILKPLLKHRTEAFIKRQTYKQVQNKITFLKIIVIFHFESKKMSYVPLLVEFKSIFHTHDRPEAYQ
jgi:hypothetical protein